LEGHLPVAGQTAQMHHPIQNSNTDSMNV